MGRKAVALRLDTGDVGAFAVHLRAALHETWDCETFDHLVNNASHGEYALIGQRRQPADAVHRFQSRGRDGKRGDRLVSRPVDVRLRCL